VLVSTACQLPQASLRVPPACTLQGTEDSLKHASAPQAHQVAVGFPYFADKLRAGILSGTGAEHTCCVSSVPTDTE
jgi:hypothetical protein